MTRSPRSDLAALERTAAEVESPLAIAGGPLELLARAVGATASMMFRFDGMGPEILGGSLKAAMADYREDHFRHDVIQLTAFRIRRIETPLILHHWDEIDWRTHRRSFAYAHFYSRVDVDGMLCIHLDEEEHGAPGQTGIVLARAPSAPPFDARELEVALHAARPLRLAMRRARKLEALQKESAAARALLADRAVMTASIDARVLWASPAAEAIATRWMAPGGWLRDPLRTTIRTLARMARKGGDDLNVPVQLELSTLPLITAELWLSSDGRGDRVIGIEIRGPSTTTRREVVRRVAAKFGLTPMEARVLLALGDALSNREIARQLSVSVETVRTHVAHVLAKLGVRSRVEAALVVAKTKVG